VLEDDEIAELEQRIDAAREGEYVEAALELLPEADREVLWLVGNDGLTPTQAAGVLGVSSAAFRMRLMRARRALHTALRTIKAVMAEADCGADFTPKEAQT
jgi:DNA-directed RNA polymerase specialized sigma24 family protein